MNFIIVFIIASAGVAQASQLPYDDYSCKSIATFIVDGKIDVEDIKEQVIRYVLTPNTNFFT